MMPYVVLLVAALSRLFPYALHGVGLNFTAVGGGLLFFGSRRPRWQSAVAAGVMAATDVYLTTVIYRAPFHVSDYAVTWAWYAAVCLLGGALLRRPSALRVGVAVLGSATSFFVLSNFVVWLTSGMYPPSAGGLATCFGAALPFYGRDLASTALTAGVLFGLPVVAHHVVTTWRLFERRRQPVA